MKVVVSALIALSVLAGVVASASAFESTQHLLPGQSPGQAAAQLDLAARVHGAAVLAEGIGHLPYKRPWTITWGHWARPNRHVVLGQHAEGVQAVAVATVDKARWQSAAAVTGRFGCGTCGPERRAGNRCAATPGKSTR